MSEMPDQTWFTNRARGIYPPPPPFPAWYEDANGNVVWPPPGSPEPSPMEQAWKGFSIRNPHGS